MKYIEKNKFDWKEYLKYCIVKRKLEKSQEKKKEIFVDLEKFMEKLGFS